MSKGNKGQGRKPGSEWFKAVTYLWVNEVLQVAETEFDTLKEAVDHLISSKCNSGKVYTHRGWMVHRHHGSHGKGHHNHGPYC
jgi:hypothetical protein